MLAGGMDAVVSGHKSNSSNWLSLSMSSNWEPTSKRAVEMGIFSKRDAQNLQKFVEADVEGKTLLDDGQQDIDRQRDPNLGLHPFSVVRFDPQMLFDPPKKEFLLANAICTAAE